MHNIRYIIVAFFCFSGRPGQAADSFYDRQIEPAVERVSDKTSLSILGLGTLSVLALQKDDDRLRDEWRDHQKIDANTSRLGDDYGIYGIGFIIAGSQIYFDQDNGISHLRALLAVTAIGTVM